MPPFLAANSSDTDFIAAFIFYPTIYTTIYLHYIKINTLL